MPAHFAPPAASPNKFCKQLTATVFIFFTTCFAAGAQFSLMFGLTYQQYTKAPKDYPYLIGLNPRLAYDIGERMQVSAQTNLEYFAKWKYENNLRLSGIVVSTYVPVPAGKNFGLGVVEINTLYTYFLLGKNYSSYGLYASAGPGAAVYVTKPSQLTSTEGFLNQHTDFILDTRLGGQVDISIGWLYLEGRLAPTLFSQGLDGDTRRPGALYGVNLGIRYLLNRHPYCVD